MQCDGKIKSVWACQTEAEQVALTLDNAEVKLVYAEGNYLLLAYYGPQQDIGMHYCNSDGTDFDFNPPNPFFWKFDNGWDIHIIIQFNWWGADRRIRVNSWPFTMDDFQLFTSDGTPLAEAYSDYNMEIKTIDNTGGALEIILSRDYDITEADIQALVDLEPYMIFTGDDGSTLRIELLVKDRN